MKGEKKTKWNLTLQKEGREGEYASNGDEGCNHTKAEKKRFPT